MSRISTSGGVVIINVTGARGRPGADGDITPALTALQVDVTNKANAAAASAGASSTSAGASNTARIAAEAAAASIPSSTAARLAALEAVAGLPNNPLPIGFRDLFGSPDGALSARPNWTVTPETPTFSGQVPSLQVSAGKVGGTGGAQAHGYYSAPAGEVWCERVLANGTSAVESGGFFENHISLGTTTAEKYMIRETPGRAVSGGLLAGNYVVSSVIANVVATIGGTSVGQLADLRIEPGDVVGYREKTVSGTKYINIYLNGVLSSVDIPYPTSVPQTGRCGFNGAIGAGVIDEFRVSSVATHAAVRLFQPNPVLDRNADGSVTWYLSGDYLGEPFLAGQALYSIIDETTGLALAGHDRQKVPNFTASNGSWAGPSAGINVPQSLLTDGRSYHVEIYRLGLRDAAGGAAEATCRGMRQKVGRVAFTFGQSLGVSSGNQTAMATVLAAAPADSYWLDGQPTLADYRRRRMTLTSNTTAAMRAATISARTSGRPVLTAGGGQSSTGTTDRLPGGVIYNALDLAILRGGRRGIIVDVGGQRGTDNSDPAGYKTRMVSTYTTLQTKYPGITCLLTPIAAVWSASGGDGGSDASIQAIRYAQWELTQDYPAIFVGLGANTLDLQHLDALHLLDGDIYGEMERRTGEAINRAKGDAVFDRNGPRFASVQRIDAQTVYCRYSLDAFDSLEMINSAVNNEHHGGMAFATSAAFTTKIYPTGHTVDAAPVDVGGGVMQQGVTFTFPPGTFPGTVYAQACQGANPFNPTNNGTINSNFATQANMIRGVKAGEPSVGLQPYFNRVSGSPQNYRSTA